MNQCASFCYVDPVIAMSIIALAAGAGLAYFSDRLPARASLLQTVAGVLIIVGLALVGLKLPVFR